MVLCAGSSTACVLVVNGTTLSASNLGDSGFVLVRDGVASFQCPQQQHNFNFPFQLGSADSMSDQPQAAMVSSRRVLGGVQSVYARGINHAVQPAADVSSRFSGAFVACGCACPTSLQQHPMVQDVAVLACCNVDAFAVNNVINNVIPVWGAVVVLEGCAGLQPGGLQARESVLP